MDLWTNQHVWLYLCCTFFDYQVLAQSMDTTKCYVLTSDIDPASHTKISIPALYPPINLKDLDRRIKKQSNYCKRKKNRICNVHGLTMNRERITEIVTDCWISFPDLRWHPSARSTISVIPLFLTLGLVSVTGIPSHIVTLCMCITIYRSPTRRVCVGITVKKSPCNKSNSCIRQPLLRHLPSPR